MNLLARTLESRQGHPLQADDLIHILLPLMREVAALHAAGCVAALRPSDIAEADDGILTLVAPQGGAPAFNAETLKKIQPAPGSALKIVGEYRVTTDETDGRKVDDLLSGKDGEAAIVKPVYLPAYECWEIRIGHHDEITDIFALGLLMASLCCGLDFALPEDLQKFSMSRRNLFALNPSLHPVVATLIMEMTALNRHDRATSLAELAGRLDTYRDQPVDLDVEQSLRGVKGLPQRRMAVLSHLRDRLFDLSRRNRLIHFRATQASVNLTEGSVPMVVRLEAIRAGQLCSWNENFSREVLGGGQVPLLNWLRFEDQPYLPAAFDRII